MGFDENSIGKPTNPNSGFSGPMQEAMRGADKRMKDEIWSPENVRAEAIHRITTEHPEMPYHEVMVKVDAWMEEERKRQGGQEGNE